MLHAIETNELLSEFNEGLTSTVDKVLKIQDPVAKEIRTFVVRPYVAFLRFIVAESTMIMVDPQLEEVWQRYYSTACHSVSCTSNGQLSQPDDELRTWILSPISISMREYEKRQRFRKTITVRCSTRTMLRGKTMKRLIGDWVKSGRTDNTIPTLRSLVFLHNPNLAALVYDHLDNHPRDLHPEIVRAVLMTLTKTEGDLISAIRSFQDVNISETSPELKMRTKLYIGRADYRAYYIDTDIIRHLCGSIIQAFLQSPNARSRERFQTQSWLPAKDKNVVNIDLQVSEDDHVLITGGDISSFTNSDINSWVYGISIYTTLLTLGELVTHPSVFCVNGQLFESCLIEVFLLYLILLIGAHAKLPDGSPYVATGGYLGVKANMTLTTLAFAIRLMDIKRWVESEYPHVTMLGQIGGDDFLYTLRGDDRTELMIVNSRILAMIKESVGNLKDPTSEFIEREGQGYLQLVFCKKRVHYSSSIESDGVRKITLKSVQKLPFMSELIEVLPAVRYKEQLDLYRKFRVQLSHFFADYIDKDFLITMYEAAYCATYDLTGLNTLHWTTKVAVSSGLVRLEDQWLTQKVAAMMVRFSHLYSAQNGWVTEKIGDRLAILTSCEAIQQSQLEALTGGELCVFHKENERDWYFPQRHAVIAQVYMTPQISRFIEWFEEARARLAPLLSGGLDDNVSLDTVVTNE